jgi:hypothetical protein
MAKEFPAKAQRRKDASKTRKLRGTYYVLLIEPLMS